MLEIKETTIGNRSAAQASELAVLVDLEACWENLRKNPQVGIARMDPTQDLKNRQKAYDVYRSKLLAYNKRYTPAHQPEMLLNTPVRLGKWCQAMRDLYVQLEQDPQARPPVHLIAKAYQWAERIGLPVTKDRAARSMPPATMRDAIRELEDLGRVCERPLALPAAA